MERCCICLDSNSKPLVNLNCSTSAPHYVHANCWIEYAHNNNEKYSCPLCRTTHYDYLEEFKVRPEMIKSIRKFNTNEETVVVEWRPIKLNLSQLENCDELLAKYLESSSKRERGQQRRRQRERREKRQRNAKRCT